MSDGDETELKDGLERKKEQARERAKAVRESAIFTRKKRGHSLTPGVKIIGSSFLESEQASERSDTADEVQQLVTQYVLGRGGFQITEDLLVDKLSKKPDSEDVMEIQIARINGLHEKWGLDRSFLSKSVFAHRFEDGAVFEHSLLSYGGYVSRTYYVVDGNEFRAFAQRNFRKESDRNHK